MAVQVDDVVLGLAAAIDAGHPVVEHRMAGPADGLDRVAQRKAGRVDGAVLVADHQHVVAVAAADAGVLEDRLAGVEQRLDFEWDRSFCGRAGAGLGTRGVIVVTGVAQASELRIGVAFEVDREGVDGVAVGIDKAGLVERTPVIAHDLADDEAVAEQRHVPVALLDQGVVATGVDEGVGASAARYFVVAQAAVQHIVKRRAHQGVIASATHQRQRQQVVSDGVGIELVVAADGGECVA